MQSRSRALIGLLLIPVAASITARLLLLFDRPLWFDELFTVWAARLSPRELVGALRFDSGPPGFYLLEKPFVTLADRWNGADALSRLLSFLAILLLFSAARTLPRGRARWTLVLLLSCSTLLNLYAGEARPYALLALLSLLLFRFSLRGEETAARLLGVAGCIALALYLHYLAVFVLGALLLLSGRARRWRSCAALLVGGMAFLPWVPTLFVQPPAALAWMRETPEGSLTGFLSALGGVGRTPAPFGPPPSHALFLAGIAGGVVLLGLMLARAREDREVGEAVGFVILVLGAAAIAGIRRPIAFAGRTEMAVLPVWIWSIARAASEGRALRWGSGLAALLGLFATAEIAWAPHPPTPSGEVTETLSRIARPEDFVVAGASFYLPARLAGDRRRLAATVRALPEDLSRHPGWFIPSLPGPDEERLLARAVDEVPPGARLFLAIPPVYATPGLTRVLSAPGGRSRELLHTRDALVLLRTRDPAAPPAAGTP